MPPITGQREIAALRRWYVFVEQAIKAEIAAGADVTATPSGWTLEPFEGVLARSTYDPRRDSITWGALRRTIEDINSMDISEEAAAQYASTLVGQASIEQRAARQMSPSDWDTLASYAREHYVATQATASSEERQATLLLVEKCTMRAAAAREGRVMP